MAELPRKSLSLALRHQRGRQIAGGWSAALEKVLGVSLGPDSFLPLEETDTLKALFFDRVKKNGSSTAKSVWSRDRKEALEAVFAQLAARVGPKRVILLSAVDEFIGAVRVRADLVLKSAFPVWSVVGRDLCIASESLDCGLCLEETLYDASGEYVANGLYELTSWGLLSQTQPVD